MNEERNSRLTRILCGLFLFVIAVVGIFHGSRAAMAYTIYHDAKFSSVGAYGPEAAARRSEDSYGFYAYNYYLCIWIAERCWYERYDSDGNESSRRVDLARVWCDRGLTLNKRKSQLRLLKTRLLARESLDEALVNWEDYVDWHFWEPYNHAVLVRYYAETGDFAGAVRSLKLIKGRKHYAEAHMAIQKAWEKEIALAPGIREKK
ncbi:MAG: hypothetical protein KAH23_01850 [Kiritimatiellae bacterium]|nr:hypothetical protein [Kiritimatiellia bacterium]